MTEYEIASVVISIVSATVTFFAVCVALWQSKLQFKRKIHVVYNNNLGGIERNSFHSKFVEFIIFNASNTKVAISNLYLGKKCKFALIGDEKEPLFQKPKVLDVGETMSVNLRFNDLIFGIKSLIKREKRIEGKKITFVVEDISGKKFYKKLDHTYNDYLLWNENKICLLPQLEEK